MALLVAGDLPRHAHMLERRHVHNVAAWQRDVRCDARALLSQRLLGDLNDDFLALLQQIRNGNLLRVGPRYGALATRLGVPRRVGARFRSTRVFSTNLWSAWLRSTNIRSTSLRPATFGSTTFSTTPSSTRPARDAMRETSAAFANLGGAALRLGIVSLTNSGLARVALARSFGLVDFNSFDVAENHRLDVEIFVFVEHRRDGRLIVGFFVLIFTFGFEQRRSFRHFDCDFRFGG